MDVVHLAEKLTRIDCPWTPGVIAELNDNQVKLARFEGEFVWHRHDDTDELFLVLSGSMGIEMRDRTIHMKEGDLFVVPRGVEHRPYSESSCNVLLIEPRGVINTGNADSALRADNDVWL
jgi:mannose-6-phosphate isomerase-like protein (cupin superfamily)